MRTLRRYLVASMARVGAQDTDVRNDQFLNNREYGAAAFTSTQTSFEHNSSITNAPAAEAGFYIGDSPDADAEVEHNVASGAQFGDHNSIHDNDKFCPPGEEGGPAVSGVGVASAGATDTHVHENQIVNNVPTGNPQLTGGLAVLTGGPGGTPPTHNHMTSNVVKGNGTDVFWDGSGFDNLFFDNHCTTGVPAGLCKK